jgi:TusA-related sulfurtransferase
MAAPLDCRGLSCPLPVLRVKEELAKGQPFAIMVDASIAVENISRFLNHQGVPFTIATQEEESLIEVRP